MTKNLKALSCNFSPRVGGQSVLRGSINTINHLQLPDRGCINAKQEILRSGVYHLSNWRHHT